VKEEKKKEHPSAEEDFTMEVMPKDEKDDIQLQKAIEILRSSVVASDVFKSVPIAAKKEETATKGKTN
jgi:hypothetical protein